MKRGFKQHKKARHTATEMKLARRETMTKISTKTLLHMAFCERCFCVDEDSRQSHLCDGCIITDPTVAAEAAREFVEKEQQQ